MYVISGFGAKATVRLYDTLAKYAEKAGFKHPEKMTSTQLRKYMATITQVMIPR